MPTDRPRRGPLQRLRRRIRPERLRGSAFDSAMLATYLLLFELLGLGFGADTPDRTIGVLLLVAVGAQAFGAALKRAPMRARRARTDPGSRGYGFLYVLLLFVFITTTVAALMAFFLLGLVAQLDQLGPSQSEWWVAIAMALGAITTGLVWSAGRPVNARQGPPPPASSQELVADAFLLVSVLIMTQLFWTTLVVGDLAGPAAGLGPGPRGVVVVLAVSALFVVFYLPSRFLILVEDRRSPWTWLQMWLTLVPIAWSVMAG